jgi:hypothetical protein
MPGKRSLLSPSPIILIALFLFAVLNVALVQGASGPSARAPQQTAESTQEATPVFTPTLAHRGAAILEQEAPLISGGTAEALPSTTAQIIQVFRTTATLTHTATRTPAPLTPTFTSTAIPPTATSTHTPTELPATPTELPPTATATLATADATDANITKAADANAMIMLLYDANQIVLLNPNRYPVNVSSLVFVQRGKDVRRFEATQWVSKQASNTIYGLRPTSCFQVANRDISPLPDPPTECRIRAAWSRIGVARWFWIAPLDGSASSFDVLWGDKLLATCAIADGRCEISLPQPSS